MTLEELIQSIHAIETHLYTFEEKYRMRSEDFYRLVHEGKIEQSADFIEWLGLYEIKLTRERKYQQRLSTLLATTTSHEGTVEQKLTLPLA
jgi:hypothetical protein